MNLLLVSSRGDSVTCSKIGCGTRFVAGSMTGSGAFGLALGLALRSALGLAIRFALEIP